MPCSQDENKNKTLDTELNPSQFDDNNDDVTVDDKHDISVDSRHLEDYSSARNISQQTESDRDSAADITKNEADLCKAEISTIYKVRRQKKVLTPKVRKVKSPEHKKKISREKIQCLKKPYQSKHDNKGHILPRYYSLFAIL